MTDTARVILASASPRRHQLLGQIGVPYRVVTTDVDERVLPGEDPATYVSRLARDKALAAQGAAGGSLPVLAADTAVVLDGHILGKPGNREEAVSMLQRLSGASHDVYSAVALRSERRGLEDALNVTRVTFAHLDPEWIEAYCESGDPMDKAGAYGVQGKAAEKITHIDGSFFGVMGLPLYETAELLRRAEVLF